MVDDKALKISLLGEMTVQREGAFVSLPPSKKTRALLAYLVVTGREQRRSRLCDMFWDVADDPKAALRWSLSKLRKLVNEPDRTRLVADRQTVQFVSEGAQVDLFGLRGMVGADLREASIEQLEQVAESVRGELVEGLELPDFDDFQAFCVAEREHARRDHATLLRELVRRFDASPEKALPHARRLVRIHPLDEKARIGMMTLLSRAGRRGELDQCFESAKRLFNELGHRDTAALTDAYRRLCEEAAPPKSSPTAPSRPPPDVTPLDDLQVDGLFGRETEVGALRSSVDGAVTGRLGVVLLLGEPGVGKSRLLEELQADVRRRGGTVLAGASYEVEQDRPYGPWIDALRGVSRVQVGEGIGHNLSALVPELAEGAGPATDLTRDRLFGAVVELISARAHSAPPVLVLLDDIHWWDEATAALLHYVVRMNRHRPVLVALAARDGELVDNDAALRVVRTLRRERVLTELAVGPLSREDTEALVRSLASGEETDRVYEDSSGNPLFALEIARSGKKGSVTQLVSDRVERLPDDCASVLRWGAVLGHDFGVERLSTLSSLGPLELASCLEQLERRALLVPMDAGGTYRFAHDLVRQVVYGELSMPRRMLMHRQVATVLAGRDAAEEVVVAEVARHAAAAGDAGMAAEACARAGQRCLTLFAPAEAYSLARRGLRHADELEGIERVKRMLELMEVSYAARRPADPPSAIARIDALAREALDHGEISYARRGFNVMSYIQWESGDYLSAAKGMLHAERVSRQASGPERVLALAEAARCLVVVDRDLPQAEAMSLEALALADQFGVERAEVPNSAGLVHMHRGDVERARTLFADSRRLARQQRDRFVEYSSIENVVTLELQERRFEDASVACRDLQEIAAKFREGSELPFANALAKLCDYALGGDEAALDAAYEELRKADAKQRQAFVLSRAAELDFERGQFERARDRAREALAHAEAVRHKSETVMAQAQLIRALASLGEDELAQQLEALRATSLTGVTRSVRSVVEAVLQDHAS